jgi:hypothetical protein
MGNLLPTLSSLDERDCRTNGLFTRQFTATPGYPITKTKPCAAALLDQSLFGVVRTAASETGLTIGTLGHRRCDLVHFDSALAPQVEQISQQRPRCSWLFALE